MSVLGDVRCASCGWQSGNTDPDPDVIARTVADHLEDCPKRYKGHPAFGFEPRWSTLTLTDGEHVEVAWSNGSWGFPFDVYEVKP